MKILMGMINTQFRTVITSGQEESGTETEDVLTLSFLMKKSKANMTKY